MSLTTESLLVLADTSSLLGNLDSFLAGTDRLEPEVEVWSPSGSTISGV